MRFWSLRSPCFAKTLGTVSLARLQQALKSSGSILGSVGQGWDVSPIGGCPGSLPRIGSFLSMQTLGSKICLFCTCLKTTSIAYRPLRSGSGRWPSGGELTLTGTKRTLGLATGGGVNVSCTRYCSRRTRECRLASHRRQLLYSLSFRCHPKPPQMLVKLIPASRTIRNWFRSRRVIL